MFSQKKLVKKKEEFRNGRPTVGKWPSCSRSSSQRQIFLTKLPQGLQCSSYAKWHPMGIWKFPVTCVTNGWQTLSAATSFEHFRFLGLGNLFKTYLLNVCMFLSHVFITSKTRIGVFASRTLTVFSSLDLLKKLRSPAPLMQTEILQQRPRLFL